MRRLVENESFFIFIITDKMRALILMQFALLTKLGKLVLKNPYDTFSRCHYSFLRLKVTVVALVIS